MPVQTRIQYRHDPMADSRRRRRLLRRSAFALGAVLLVAGSLWLLFGSSVFAVRTVQVRGAAAVSAADIESSVWEVLDQRSFYVFQPHRNIMFLDAAAIGDHIRSSFPALASVSVAKAYPHGLTVDVGDRKAVGVWCRGQDCRLVDSTGTRWGAAMPSSGPLLLLFQDERQSDDLDVKFFANIMAAVDGLPSLGLTVRTVTLPNAEPGGIRLATAKGYDLLMDAAGDVADQLSVLAVFLADRAKDPAFAPQYVDLRTPGRVYYK